MWDDPKFTAIRRRVAQELPDHLRDPAFRDELERETSPHELRNAVVTMMNFFEGMGIYAKHGLADKDVIFDFWGGIIVVQWKRLAPAVAIMRRTRGELVYLNFQYIASAAEQYLEAHPNGIMPKGAALGRIDDEWLEIDRRRRADRGATAAD